MFFKEAIQGVVTENATKKLVLLLDPSDGMNAVVVIVVAKNVPSHMFRVELISISIVICSRKIFSDAVPSTGARIP